MKNPTVVGPLGAVGYTSTLPIKRGNCLVFLKKLQYHNGRMTIEEIKEKAIQVLKQNHVEYSAFFGSTARGEDRPDSDIDILVRLGRPTGMIEYVRLVEGLENGLKKKVDLVTEQS